MRWIEEGAVSHSRLFKAWFAFCTIFALALLGGGIYVAVHFIGKYW